MIHYYHPNKASTGSACSFADSMNNDCVYASILKQSGWDEKSGNGTFKASLDDKTQSVTVKLSDLEVAAILDCIERGRPFSTYHDGDSAKQIQFVPWFSKTPVDEGKKPEQRGFSFSVTSTLVNGEESAKHSFYIGLKFEEARLLREYLVNALHSHYNTLRINTAAQYAAKNSSAKNLK